MDFTRRAPRIWTTIIEIVATTLTGTRLFGVALRIAPEDVRRQSGPYRIDLKTLSFEPWEAITSDTFATKAGAEAYARAWVKRARAQQTFHPKAN